MRAIACARTASRRSTASICRAPALDVIAWGGDPRTLEWFERPRDEALDAALTLLERLGPRMRCATARLHRRDRRAGAAPAAASAAGADAGRGRRRAEIAQACALLSERHLLPPRTATTSSDLLSALDDWSAVPPHVQRVATHCRSRIADCGFRIAIRSQSESAIRNRPSEATFRRAILAGYPDRVAQRREPGSPNVRLASGTGATIAPESGVRDGEFLVALDVSRQSGNPQSRSPRSAVRDPQSRTDPHREPRRARVAGADRVGARPPLRRGRAARCARSPSIATTRWCSPSGRRRSIPKIAARLLADAWLARGPRRGRRAAAAPAAVRRAGRRPRRARSRPPRTARATLDDVRLDRALPPDVLRALDRDAPESLAVPSGRHRPLDYHDDGRCRRR